MTEIESWRVKVFEVDTPHPLDRKRRALARAGVKIPARIVFVPFEFDTRDLEGELGGALEVAGSEPRIGAMFVWEGVIGYIDDAAIHQSLRFVVAEGGPRSRLAFTFADEAHLGTEPMAARTKRCGFAGFESASGDELWRRYLPGEPHPNAWVTKVGLATV